MDADRLAFYVALLFLAWWGAGGYANRRRLARLARLLAGAVPALGSGATLEAVGNGALRVEVGQPLPGLRAVQLLCLLEPRDFPLAWAWTRWRGLRDRLVVRAVLGPEAAARAAALAPAAGAPVEGLRHARVAGSPPCLELVVDLPPGQEERRIGQAVAAVAALTAAPARGAG